jgi:hypothetical protein
VPLPSNIRVLTLPDLELARNYPTLGPTGLVSADINGRACGLELYCGTSALLSDDGGLRPVQWTGYDRAMKRYQGEPLDKEVIKERYLVALSVSMDPASDVQFESMTSVLRLIMGINW